MDTADLRPEQIEAMFAVVDRYRLFHEKLYRRCLECGFPPNDLLRDHARRSLLAFRQLALTVNDQRRKGLCRRFMKQSQSWPPV